MVTPGFVLVGVLWLVIDFESRFSHRNSFPGDSFPMIRVENGAIDRLGKFLRVPTVSLEQDGFGGRLDSRGSV